MTASNPVVLVVDDESNICNVVRRVLEKEGYQIIMTCECEAMIWLIKRRGPKSVILNLVMPRIDDSEI